MADPLTEKKAEKRQAEQRLRDLTADHLRAKSAAREILTRQATGKALDTDAAALTAADANVATVEASIQAATRLVNDLAPATPRPTPSAASAPTESSSPPS